MYVDPDGSDSLNLTRGLSGLNEQPRWAPDGVRLAFIGVGDSSVGQVVLTMNGDGSNISNILRATGPCCQSPAWSPGGGRIAFVQTFGSGDRVMIVNSNGSAPRPLNPAFPAYLAPQWRP